MIASRPIPLQLGPAIRPALFRQQARRRSVAAGETLPARASRCGRNSQGATLLPHYRPTLRSRCGVDRGSRCDPEERWRHYNLCLDTIIDWPRVLIVGEPKAASSQRPEPHCVASANVTWCGFCDACHIALRCGRSSSPDCSVRSSVAIIRYRSTIHVLHGAPHVCPQIIPRSNAILFMPARRCSMTWGETNGEGQQHSRQARVNRSWRFRVFWRQAIPSDAMIE